MPEINVCIEPELRVCLDEDVLKMVASKALDGGGVTGQVEMGLVITDNEAIRELNRTYRGRDEPTDVLSFQMLDKSVQESEPAFAVPPDEVHHLGEVIISYPKVLQQSVEMGHSMERELALLIVHGVLHLLGYDHEQDEDGELMEARQREVMTSLGYL